MACQHGDRDNHGRSLVVWENVLKPHWIFRFRLHCGLSLHVVGWRRRSKSSLQTVFWLQDVAQTLSGTLSRQQQVAWVDSVVGSGCSSCRKCCFLAWTNVFLAGFVVCSSQGLRVSLRGTVFPKASPRGGHFSRNVPEPTHYFLKTALRQRLSCLSAAHTLLGRVLYTSSNIQIHRDIHMFSYVHIYIFFIYLL